MKPTIPTALITAFFCISNLNVPTATAKPHKTSPHSGMQQYTNQSKIRITPDDWERDYKNLSDRYLQLQLRLAEIRNKVQSQQAEIARLKAENARLAKARR